MPQSGATESEGELYVALTAMCAPFPLGGAARGAPRTDVVRRTSAHTCAPPKGVAWGGAEGGCARGHGSSPSWAGGGAVWGGVPPLGAATQIHTETPCLHLLQRTSIDADPWPHSGHTLATLLDPWPHFGHTLATLWPHFGHTYVQQNVENRENHHGVSVRSGRQAAAGVFPRSRLGCGHR